MTDITKLKLGKSPARIDPRSMKLSAIMRTLPPLPDEFDVDRELDILENRMFANDQYGDCAMASFAKLIMRLEKFEQGQMIDVIDADVVNTYKTLTGGGPGWENAGLVMLDVLKYMRKVGITIDGKTYQIHAFATVNWRDHEDVKASIYLLHGLYLGALLPRSAQNQLDSGLWDVADGPDGTPGSWGGHAMYGMAYRDTGVPPPAPATIPWYTRLIQLFLSLFRKRVSVMRASGYTAIGPVLKTWDKTIQTTWAWWDKYVEECYVVVDARDLWLGDASPLNIETMEGILKEITA